MGEFPLKVAQVRWRRRQLTGTKANVFPEKKTIERYSHARVVDGEGESVSDAAIQMPSTTRLRVDE